MAVISEELSMRGSRGFGQRVSNFDVFWGFLG